MPAMIGSVASRNDTAHLSRQCQQPLMASLRVANRLLALTDRLRRRPTFALTREDAIRIAMARTGLRDFGGDLPASLESTCRSLTLPPAMKPLGRFMRRTEILQQLVTKLHIVQTVKQDPSILQAPVTRPWFVVGLPRTGTTLLHRLLAQDPAHRAPRFWEMHSYYPIPDRARARKDKRMRKSERAIGWLNFFAPQIKAIHEMGAEFPEECTGMLAVGLATTRDATTAYGLHKTHLQILQHETPPRRWVLKSPLHLIHLKQLFSVYPDACIIQLHRDLAEVVPSLASMQAVDARHRFAEVDLRRIAQQVLSTALYMIESGIQARKLPGSDTGQRRFVDVRYSDLVNDPLGVVRSLYEACELALSPLALRKMGDYLRDNKQNKHGPHQYALEDFGLTADGIRRAFTSYTDSFLERSAEAAVAAPSR